MKIQGKLKQWKDKRADRIWKEYNGFKGEKSVIIDRLSEKYCISVSNLYSIIRKHKSHEGTN